MGQQSESVKLVSGTLPEFLQLRSREEERNQLHSSHHDATPKAVERALHSPRHIYIPGGSFSKQARPLLWTEYYRKLVLKQ
jgi:hypothetical protein